MNQNEVLKVTEAIADAIAPELEGVALSKSGEVVPLVGTPTDTLAAGKQRAVLRKGLMDLIENKGVGVLVAILDNPDASFNVKMRAVEACMRYGIGETQTILLENDELIRIFAGVLARHVDAQKFSAIIQDLQSAVRNIG